MNLDKIKTNYNYIIFFFFKSFIFLSFLKFEYFQIRYLILVLLLPCAAFFLKDIKKCKMLEIGCGDGSNLKRFKDRGIDTYALDFDIKAIETAKLNGLGEKLLGLKSW